MFFVLYSYMETVEKSKPVKKIKQLIASLCVRIDELKADKTLTTDEINWKVSELIRIREELRKIKSEISFL